MNDYTVRVASINNNRHHDTDIKAQGTINVDDIIVKWTLYRTRRHFNLAESIGSESEGFFDTYLPASALRTNPPGWRKHRDAKAILKAIKDAVDNEYGDHNGQQ